MKSHDVSFFISLFLERIKSNRDGKISQLTSRSSGATTSPTIASMITEISMCLHRMFHCRLILLLLRVIMATYMLHCCHLLELVTSHAQHLFFHILVISPVLFKTKSNISFLARSYCHPLIRLNESNIGDQL